MDIGHVSVLDVDDRGAVNVPCYYKKTKFNSISEYFDSLDFMMYSYHYVFCLGKKQKRHWMVWVEDGVDYVKRENYVKLQRVKVALREEELADN
jgi:hypothetical protein